MSSSEEVARKLDALWQRFLPTILARLAAIELAIESLETGRLDRERNRNASEEAHKLAGSLGIFGLASTSAMSSEIENLLSQPDLAESMAAELRKMFDSIKREIENR